MFSGWLLSKDRMLEMISYVDMHLSSSKFVPSYLELVEFSCGRFSQTVGGCSFFYSHL